MENHEGRNMVEISYFRLGVVCARHGEFGYRKTCPLFLSSAFNADYGALTVRSMTSSRIARRPSTLESSLDRPLPTGLVGPASVLSISARARSRYARLALRIPRRERRALALCREQAYK